MTFGGNIVYLWPEQHHLRPTGTRVQMMLRGAQINYMPDKSHVMIIIYTQGYTCTLLTGQCIKELTITVNIVKKDLE